MTEPRVETCPNCGAPLRLDAKRQCAFCRAHIRSDGEAEGAPSPAGAILRTIGMLISEPAAQRVVDAQGLADPVTSLSDAIVAAGQRVRDDGLVLSERAVDLKIYEPAEVWTFNLAADLIAVLVVAPNLPKAKRVAVRDVLMRLDAGLGTHWARSTIGNAAPGPEPLQGLRAALPHRKPLRR